MPQIKNPFSFINILFAFISNQENCAGFLFFNFRITMYRLYIWLRVCVFVCVHLIFATKKRIILLGHVKSQYKEKNNNRKRKETLTL